MDVAKRRRANRGSAEVMATRVDTVETERGFRENLFFYDMSMSPSLKSIRFEQYIGWTLWLSLYYGTVEATPPYQPNTTTLQIKQRMRIYVDALTRHLRSVCITVRPVSVLSRGTAATAPPCALWPSSQRACPLA